jgi:hypothetical protein
VATLLTPTQQMAAGGRGAGGQVGGKGHSRDPGKPENLKKRKKKIKKSKEKI